MITREEEKALRMYYIFKIQDIGKKLKYHENVIVSKTLKNCYNKS